MTFECKNSPIFAVQYLYVVNLKGMYIGCRKITVNEIMLDVSEQ